MENRYWCFDRETDRYAMHRGKEVLESSSWLTLCTAPLISTRLVRGNDTRRVVSRSLSPSSRTEKFRVPCNQQSIELRKRVSKLRPFRRSASADPVSRNIVFFFLRGKWRFVTRMIQKFVRINLYISRFLLICFFSSALFVKEKKKFRGTLIFRNSSFEDFSRIFGFSSFFKRKLSTFIGPDGISRCTLLLKCYSSITVNFPMDRFRCLKALLFFYISIQ